MVYDQGTLNSVISALREASEIYKVNIYIVGGAVRDLFGLRQPRDIDVITSGDAAEIAMFLEGKLYGAESRSVRAPFQLYNVTAMNGISVDIVGNAEDIQLDYQKRNFTINAIYYDVRNDKFLDPSGHGIMDLHDHLIRAVSPDAFKGERDDNIFIALRLVSEIGFGIDTRTLHMMASAVREKGAGLNISKRAQSEIKRCQQGMFVDKMNMLANYIGLEQFIRNYKSAVWRDMSLRQVIARYKSKKITEKGNVVYEYSDKDKKARADKKAKHVRNVFKNINKVVKAFERDMKSDDEYTKMTALAVAMIYYTYERVGNRDNIGTGVTSLKKKHIKIAGNKTKLNYIGKSHVKQQKEIDNAQVTRLISELLEGKKPNDYLFHYEGVDYGNGIVDIYPTDVNEWLKPFNITAKDLRAHAANDLIIKRLKEAATPGKDLSDEEAKKFRKKELKEAIEDVAEQIGHTPAICKSSYIDPKIINEYEESGRVAKISSGAIPLFKGGGEQEPIEGYAERHELGPDNITELKSKIDSNDVDIDPDMQNVEDVTKAIQLIKELDPETFRGVLMLVPAEKSPVPVPGDAFGFVLSHEPFIVYLDTNKIKNAINSGASTSTLSSELAASLKNEIPAQIAGVIKHESEHSKGEDAEAKPYDEQKRIVDKALETSKSSHHKLMLRMAAQENKDSEDPDVFSALEMSVSKSNIIPKAKELIDRLKLGKDENGKAVNSALLALGYLIRHKENPYRAEWHVRKAFHIKDNLKFEAATELYELLNQYITKESMESNGNQIDNEAYARLGLWADPSQEESLGDVTSPKWEARPNIQPEDWHGFYPERQPINY